MNARTRIITRAASATLVAASLLWWSGCERVPSTNQGGSATAPSPGATPPVNTNALAYGPKMVLVHGGQFLMGLKGQVDATPHEVTVSSFLMDSTLVTQDQYKKVMGDNPARWKSGSNHGNNPVEQVRWIDAVKYCNKRSELEGLKPCYDLKTWKCNFDNNGYRLPTEAEWEYAYRAGTSSQYYFGDNPSKLGDYAWYQKDSDGHPHPVAEKQPNPWGLYDMCGDEWEWCNDYYQVNYYKHSPATNPPGPATGQTRVVRGGSFRSSADMCRAGYRYNENQGYADVCFGYDIYGFRCVRKAGK